MNVPRGSRKDARDAVLAAKSARSGWAARTAFNRGQILYRLAEVMESRRDGARDVARARRGRRERGGGARSMRRSIAPSSTPASATSTRRSSRPRTRCAGPHFGFSVPEPMGVVGRRRAGAAGAARPRVDRAAGHRRRATPCVVDRRRGRPADRDRLLRVPGDERSARGRRQRAHRAGERDGAAPGQAPRGQRDRRLDRRRRAPRRARARGRRTT